MISMRHPLMKRQAKLYLDKVKAGRSGDVPMKKVRCLKCGTMFGTYDHQRICAHCHTENSYVGLRADPSQLQLVT